MAEINLSDLYSEFEDEIKTEVDALSMSLPLSGAQLKAAFTKDELVELEQLLGKVQAATFENEKAALLGMQSNVVLKLVSALGVAVGL